MKKAPLYLSIACPTKPHLRKFLEADLPSSKIADLNTIAGRSLITVLNRSNSQFHSFHNQCADYDDLLITKVSEDHINRTGMQLQRKHILFLNGMWERIFQEVAFTSIDVCMDLNPRNSFREIMDAVLDRYNITETDLSYETLRKRYYRHRKKQEKLLGELSL